MLDLPPVPTPIPLNVLIVGAGPAGLATAISVTLAGHNATIFESSDQPHPFGSGFQCSPNGTRLLLRWGLEEILKPVASSHKLLQIYDIRGKLILQKRNHEGEFSQRDGSPLWTFHRVDFQAGLLQRATELGVRVHYSARITDLETSKPEIRLTNGQTHRGDLVVVADGTWSTLRSKVLGRVIRPEPTGDLAYRITISRGQIQDETVRNSMQLPQIRTWIAPGAHVVGYSMRKGTQYSLLLLLPHASSKETGNMAAIAEEMRKRAEGWDPTLTAMLKSVQKVNKWCLVQGANTVPELTTLVSPQATCVLAGDSGHSMRPFLGQGLSLGLEDAGTLGSLLAHVENPSQLPKALSLYERLRMSRAKSIRQETGRLATCSQFENAEPYAAATTEIASSQEYGNMYKRAHTKAQEWIWSYDAYEEAERAYLKHSY
ncbi:hypothetical protein BKA67DRAFT_663999 [Truncatella angustata]|uniref:FAD-binding domain-containing protein n=1 Tax=Truncatella angustata TaxID=152316 RepID=A0A9P8RL96_9PEZI|nr:uncharacterized protein BKA67DRAFT_663999 [Truncatella angustata]KAH6646141.1 hypothetical protein BKA67DRAFT_663999 [Truncatella angustata]